MKWITYLLIFQFALGVGPQYWGASMALASRCIEATEQSREILTEVKSQEKWQELLERYNTRYWSKINRSSFLIEVASRIWRLVPATLHTAAWMGRVAGRKLIEKSVDPAFYTKDVLTIQEFLNKDIRKKISELEKDVDFIKAQIPHIREQIEKAKEDSDFTKIEELEAQLETLRQQQAKKMATVNAAKKTNESIKKKYIDLSKVLVDKHKQVLDLLERGLSADLQREALAQALELFPIPRFNRTRRWISHPIVRKAAEKAHLQKVMPSVRFNEKDQLDEPIEIFLPVLKGGQVVERGTSILVYDRADIRDNLRRLKDVRTEYLGGFYRKARGRFGVRLDQLETDYAENKMRIRILVRHILKNTDLTKDQKELLLVLREALKSAQTNPFVRVKSHLAGRLFRAEIGARIAGLDESFEKTAIHNSSLEILGEDGVNSLAKAAGVSSFKPSSLIKYGKQIVLSTVAAVTVGLAFTTLKEEITDATKYAYGFVEAGTKSIYYRYKYDIFGEKSYIEDLFERVYEDKTVDPDREFSQYISRNYSDVVEAMNASVPSSREMAVRMQQYIELMTHFSLIKEQMARQTEANKMALEVQKRREEAIQQEMARFQTDIVAAQRKITEIARASSDVNYYKGIEALLEKEAQQDKALDIKNRSYLLDLFKSGSTYNSFLAEVQRLNLQSTTVEQLSTLVYYRDAIQTYRADKESVGKGITQKEMDDYIDGLISSRVLIIFSQTIAR
ncbi:MAG: hypothetical protein KDD61_03345 [Bdellovibrionales bacterium]|nr:hypothetical protein [Bdellovibrionales bacterium]